jgi:hypothetical protein
MPPRAKFRYKGKEFGKVLASKQMQREMEIRAEKVKDRAESLAPEETGDYKSSFRVEVEVRPGPKPRAIAKVINASPAAPYVEWGTSKTPRFRVMGKAAGSSE